MVFALILLVLLALLFLGILIWRSLRVSAVVEDELIRQQICEQLEKQKPKPKPTSKSRK
jgi:sensor domain CHASE-containing protein